MALYALWMVIITTAMTFVTGFGVFWIYRTLGYTRDAAVFAANTLEQAKEATKAALATVTEAEKTTVAANRQARHQEQAFKRLERPYLFIRPINEGTLNNPDKHNVPYIEYTLVNPGKTPAILRSVYVELIPSPKLPLRAPIDASELIYKVIEASGSTRPRRVPVKGSEPGTRWQGRTRSTLILHGLITYEDPTGALHQDRFCLRANEGAGFHLDGGTEYNCRKTEYPEDRGGAAEDS